MIKLVYLSWCQPYPIDWQTLKQNVGGVMIRSSQATYEDELFRKHYQAAVESDTPFLLWHFWQPNQPAAPQVEFLKGLLNSLPVKPKAIALDVESIEWWKDGVRQPDIVPPSVDFSHREMLAACKALAALGYKVGFYTRKDYFERWTYNSPDWLNYWLWIAAWYQYTGNVPPALPWGWTDYKIHQYGGGQYNAIPGIGANSVCLEYWNGTPEQINEYFVSSGGYTPPTEPPTTGGSMIHNKDVAQNKRAWVMTVESDQKLTVDWKSTWVDAYILSMGGVFFRKLADGNKRLFIEADTSFAGRCSEVALAGLPVVGRFVLDAGALLKAGWTASAAEAPLKENEITKALMNAWCGANWTWDQVLTKKAAWREVAAIELELINTSGYPDSAVVGNDWQKRVIKTVTDHIRYLQQGGFAPNIPIILYTTPEFLAQYDKPDTDFALWLAGQTGWLWLHLRQTTLDSTATFYAPTNVFAFPPADAFTWSYCPAGYFERVVMHEFTYGKQKLTCLVDAGGAASEAGLSLGCDDAAWLFKFLDIEAPMPPVEPPVEPPAPELSELYEAIAELRDDMTLFHDEIIAGLEELTARLKNL